MFEVVEIEVLVGVEDVGFALIEGFFSRPGLGAAQRRLQQQVSEQEVGEGPVGLDGAGVVESSWR